MLDPTKTQFDSSQYQHVYPEGIERHWWHLTRNEVILGWLRREGATCDVLDVGCGRGIVLAHLRAHGIDGVGVELGVAKPLAAVRDHIRYGLDARQIPTDERARYRTLTLFDVLEHLPEPEAFLRDLIAAYPVVDRLVVTVPACRELWSNFDLVNRHYRRYDAASLRELAAQAGCGVRRMSYFFHTPYLPARMLAGEGKDNRRSTQVDAPHGFNNALHHLVAFAMRLDYTLLPSSLKGSSLIANATR